MTVSWRICRLMATIAIVALVPLPLLAQAVKGDVRPEDPPPALTYHGLIPGLSSANDVRQKLGEPAHQAAWYAWKMLYPAKGRPGLVDSVHLHGERGKFSCVEAASVPDGYATKADVRKKLGEPEHELRMPTFSMLDYTAKGVRFVFDVKDATTGVAYVPHLRARVHSGARKLVDLSKLRQGPQPEPVRPASLGNLRAGAAEIVITPKKEWLSPLVQRGYAPHDNLYARCVVFERDGLAIALCGTDLFGMSMSEIEPVRDRLKAEGIDYALFAASHNHAAPDTLGVYGHFPIKYIADLQEKFYQVARQAYQNLKPVREFKTASKELPMDGARVIGYFRNARNPGLLDPTISLIEPIGEDGKPIASIVNFACHTEGIDAGVKELTADFPGYMCEAIKAGGGGQPVFLNGAIGGMISGDNKARTHAEAKVMGEGLAKFVAELRSIAQPPATFAFAVDVKRAEVPLTKATYKPLLEIRGRLHRGRVKTELALVTLGEAQILTIPGELLPEISFEIQEKMTGFPRLLVGLANDEMGYIIPTYDYRDDYYEETMSPGPATAPVVEDTAIRLLTGVK